MADIELNNTVYNESSSTSNSISDSLIAHRPSSENQMDSEIDQNPNEIESFANSSGANDNLSSDVNLNTECEIDNSNEQYSHM